MLKVSLVVLVVVFWWQGSAGAQKNCGIRVCQAGTYCSQLEGACIGCEKICSEDHNYDERLCHNECKDWLTNKQRAQSVEVQQLKENIKTLQSSVRVSFIISGIAILLSCFLVLILTYKWCQRKGFQVNCFSLNLNKEKKKPTNNNKIDNPPNLSDVKVQAVNNNGDLRLQMPDSSPTDTMAETVDSPQTISTAISRRAPSESRALDYAYDNPAMSTQGTKGSRDSSF